MLEEENIRLEYEARSLNKALQAEKERGTAFQTQLETQQEEIVGLKARIADKAAQVWTPDSPFSSRGGRR